MSAPYLPSALATACLLVRSTLEGTSLAEDTKNAARAKTASTSKPWCGPDVTELSDHVCFFDGGVPDGGRRTLVVYLHGALAMTPGFQYLSESVVPLRVNFAVRRLCPPAGSGVVRVRAR